MDVPKELLSSLTHEDRIKTLTWWETLEPEAQLEFSQCWDDRSDDTALHGVSRGGEIEWHPLPIELRGRIVDEENRIDDRLARQQLLEFINNHEEVQFFLVDGGFHVCRDHVGARACLRAGVIPKAFSCGKPAHACPMQRILHTAGGQSVELVPIGPKRRLAE